MHDTVAAFLRSRFGAALRGRDPGFDDPLISSGIVDSFGVLELLAFLEDTFHIRIDSASLELIELDTVNRIVSVVEGTRRAS